MNAVFSGWLVQQMDGLRKELQDIYAKALAEEAVYSWALVEAVQAEYKQAGIDLTQEEALEEVICRSMEGILDDGNVFQQMMEYTADADPTLFDRIREWLKEFADKLRSIVEAYRGAKPGTAEGQLLQQAEDYLYTAEAVYSWALVETGQKTRTKGNEKTAREGGKVRESITQVVGGSGTNYGVGVYLDTTLFDGLSEDESRAMLREFVTTELQGRNFLAYDGQKNAVDIMVARKNEKIRTRSGEKKQVIKELYNKNNGKEIKRKAVVHVDELFMSAQYDGKRLPSKPHDWLDNYGQNNWEYWTVYIQEKDGSVWEATLNIANASDGRKILYDISPIKKVEGAISSAPTSTEVSVAQKKHEVKQKFSISPASEISSEEKKQHAQAAKDFFGKTYYWKETGYLLADGTKLDFSGRHEGGPGGYRTVDHRDIRDAIGEDYGGDDYSGSMVEFMREGNIRIMPESSGINLCVEPTKAQETALSDFISRMRGEVILDLDDMNGNTVSSTEYPRGTRASKVLADIHRFFETGEKPYVSEVAQFRYSNSNPALGEVLAAEDSAIREDLPKLRELVSMLKNVKGGLEFSRRTIESVARVMMDRTGVSGNVKELADILERFYSFVSRGEELTLDRIQEEAREAAITATGEDPCCLPWPMS